MAVPEREHGMMTKTSQPIDDCVRCQIVHAFHVCRTNDTANFLLCSFRKADTDPPTDWILEFREIVGGQIAKYWPKDRARAQEASDLLDRGNRLLLAFERSGKILASTSGNSSQSADDSFWELPPSHWQTLLGLKAERGPGPATLPAEEASGRKRCMILCGSSLRFITPHISQMLAVSTT